MKMSVIPEDQTIVVDGVAKLCSFGGFDKNVRAAHWDGETAYYETSAGIVYTWALAFIVFYQIWERTPLPQVDQEPLPETIHPEPIAPPPQAPYEEPRTESAPAPPPFIPFDAPVRR